jgi:hypothetical protein
MVMCYQNGVALKSFMLLALHYSVAYQSELAKVTPNKYSVQSATIIQMKSQDTLLIVHERTSNLECSSKGRASIEHIVRYPREQSDLLAYSERVKTGIHMHGIIVSKEIKKAQETTKRHHLLFTYSPLSLSKLQRLEHSIPLFPQLGCQQRLGRALQMILWLSSQWCIIKLLILTLLSFCGTQTVKGTILIADSALFTDNEEVQRKSRLQVWEMATPYILQHTIISWFNICHFKHDDHTCVVCPWKKHLLIVTARYGKECKQAFMSHTTRLLHRHLQQFDNLHCWTHHGEINDQVKLSREQITTSTSTYLVEMQSGSILLRVAGSLLFMLLFYCPVIDDPG